MTASTVKQFVGKRVRVGAVDFNPDAEGVTGTASGVRLCRHGGGSHSQLVVALDEPLGCYAELYLEPGEFEVIS